MKSLNDSGFWLELYFIALLSAVNQNTSIQQDMWFLVLFSERHIVHKICRLEFCSEFILVKPGNWHDFLSSL